MFNAVTKYR